MKSSVSVITFAFVSQENGRRQLLEECLASVASQTYSDYEHIIIDDGSTVNLSTMVEQFPNTKLVRKEQTGILTNTATFNAGHLMAANKYCIYLASDDLQTANCLSALTKFLDDNEHCIAVCGEAEYIDIEQNVTKYRPDWEDDNAADLANSLVYLGNKVSGCAVMWRNNILDKKFLAPKYHWVLFRLRPLGEVSGGRTDREMRGNCCTISSKAGLHALQNTGQRYFQPSQIRSKFFQFSKFARIRYVKNSALKRRMRSKFRTTCQ